MWWQLQLMTMQEEADQMEVDVEEAEGEDGPSLDLP